MPTKTAQPETCEVHLVDEERVESVRRAMPGDRSVQRMSDTFQMLADPTRTRVLLALGDAELCVCDLAALLGLTSPAVSHHLRLLRGMGLVKLRREGRLAYYSLDDDHVLRWIRDCLDHVEHR